jgi:hypothetical protein
LPEHESSRVVLGGRYLRGGVPQQLYVCHMAKPGSAKPFHRFAAPLSRAAVDDLTGTADEPDQRAPRSYQYTAQELATALVAVARGSSYTEAGRKARVQAAIRRGADPVAATPRAHGTLVGDWVEVYAEALWDASAPLPGRWPRTVFIAAAPLVLPAARGGRPRLAFVVMMAGAYDDDGRLGVLAVRTAAGRTADDWHGLLRAAGAGRAGAPETVVSDGSAGPAIAVERMWGPAAPLMWTDHHDLRSEAAAICRRHGLDRRGDRLWSSLLAAWRSPADWRRFARQAGRYRVPELDRWLATRAPTVVRQLTAGARPERHSRQPLQTMAVQVTERIWSRRGTFTNRARTDRLLLLIALDVSGRARVNTWTRQICEWLERTGGRPRAIQRRIVDRDDRPSLSRTPRA